MCLSWRDLLRNYPRPLCESPAVLKGTIPLAYLGLLFTDNCCKQAFIPTTHRLGSKASNGYAGKFLKAGLNFNWSALEDDFRTLLWVPAQQAQIQTWR